jgi:hypothetical protein
MWWLLCLHSRQSTNSGCTGSLADIVGAGGIALLGGLAAVAAQPSPWELL